MKPASGTVISLAYILGLLSTGILNLPTGEIPWQEYRALVTGLVVTGIVAAIAFPSFWRTGPKPRLWVAAGLISALAVVYFQLRVPQPELNDISEYVPSSNTIAPEQVFKVEGKVESMPRLTRNQRTQLWLQTTQLTEIESREDGGAISQGVTGKLYVTVPLLQGTGIYPGQIISVTGVLYKPKPVTNPGAFDFGAYLARQGAFAGLSGRQINFDEETIGKPWGWWRLRQRIIRSQVSLLGSPTGPLISSMVLGRRAVDLPYDIRDQFIQAGLAYTLAASGFHVSLLLGFVLALTRGLTKGKQFSISLSVLLIYVALTGLQPSVMRAALMGLGALIALVTARKVKPLGSLLLAATLLLLFNPLWIWDVGFQLSFLATLGLLVTASGIIQRLDWLPPAIASLVAVPIAAAVWTLPLQLYVFQVVATYSIPLSVIATPLISIITLGGIVSALAGLIWPTAGSGLAWLLYYPTHGLMGLVQFFNQLPGSSVAVSKISLGQLLFLYGLIVLACLIQWLHPRWWLISLVAVTVVVLPQWQQASKLFQVTVLATGNDQILVIQNQGQVTLVNSGNPDTVRFTVLPFLQKQGINHINWAVALDKQPQLRSGWVQVLGSLPIETFYDNTDLQPPLSQAQNWNDIVTRNSIASAVASREANYQPIPVGEILSVGSTSIELVNSEPPVLLMRIIDQNWLLLGDLKPGFQKQLAKTIRFPELQVLWWSGKSLRPEFLDALQPKIAIASSNVVDSYTAKLMRNAKMILYWTGRDGAIQWTPDGGFKTTVEDIEIDIDFP
ncbi:competence protein [Moorena producens PAL-8-15-08-1]|uniref:Competence protein n=1 Tax=Moorena producens PAL-8-15-08-1 TaxID=1458985 RepID=A0A1D8TQG4_9CYAN|nr:ComEC/Rec2 family competence protein [Moorena producens]AOW99822.1 competence protein [Moorena producens PAL-8-15-08-1]